MAKAITVDDRAVRRKLKKMAPALQRKAFRKSTRAVAKILKPDIKDATPKDDGTLRKTLKVRSAKRSTVRVGAEVQLDQYALHLETGTEDIEALHFMRDASKKQESKIQSLLTKTTFDEINKAWEQR